MRCLLKQDSPSNSLTPPHPLRLYWDVVAQPRHTANGLVARNDSGKKAAVRPDALFEIE
jgi:hypothetical protein